ncbi:DUF4748 domain-containing protein [Xiphias gladius]|uniref:DUF4748 domain-containing protein n=1 Tax=Xiphias gladius TaxID=8245 RepID=UPI001A9838AD|nr:DUF4748 domain-containing protein [Xiphias gladius]
MAACYVSASRTALKGAHLVPGRWLLTRSGRTPTLCQCSRLPAARCRPLHVSPAASVSSSRTEPERSTGADDGRPGEEEEPEGPEYIPRKKARNPMMKIGYAWMIGLPVGIISFILAKRAVDKNRLKQLKIRQRMKSSNEGEYEGSRYRHHGEDVNLDQ